MNALEQLRLRGPVQKLRSEHAQWDIASGQWEQPKGWTTIQFRPDGEISEREDRNPIAFSRTKYRYDGDGRLQESVFQLNDGPTSTRVCRYDESGRLSRVVAISEAGIEQESEICSYDANGRKTKLQIVPKSEDRSTPACYGVEGAEKSYGAQGVTAITTLYDDRGQPREALLQDENQTVILRVVLTRDNKQRVVKEESQSGDRSPFPIEQILENTSPDEREATAAALAQMFGAQKSSITSTYRYDDAGRQIERSTSMYGLSEERTTCDYDEHDNPVFEVEERTTSDLQAGASGNLQRGLPKSYRREIRYDYKYDAHGNWTERTVSGRYENNPDFQLSAIERREIRYY
jgi:hypothetical protein